jgi:hypothetical protein
MLQNADRIVTEDQAWQRMNTVPQQLWRDDGTLPIAAHVVLNIDSETGETSILWTGESYAGTVQCVTQGLQGPLRVRPTFEMHGDMPVMQMLLVDDEGKSWANLISMVW